MPNTGEASGETDANFPVAEFGTETSTEELRNPTTPPRPNTPRASCDPVAASKMAWKLYQGEIGEEGIALIDDQDARDLARRCFRLAEIFLDEQARRAR